MYESLDLPFIPLCTGGAERITLSEQVVILQAGGVKKNKDQDKQCGKRQYWTLLTRAIILVLRKGKGGKSVGCIICSAIGAFSIMTMDVVQSLSYHPKALTECCNPVCEPTLLTMLKL